MSIIGFTPIDSALTALGLNLSARLLSIIFIETPIGAVFFALGFLLTIGRSLKGKLAYPAFFLTILSSVLILSIRTNLDSFQSAQEKFAQTPQHAKDIKDSFLNNSEASALLAFLNQGFDVMGVGLISGLDQLFPENIRFLDKPFGPQLASFNLNYLIAQPIADRILRIQVKDFINDYYWPVLARLNPKNLKDHWPGQEKIIQQYPDSGKLKWQTLNNNLNQYIQLTANAQFLQDIGAWLHQPSEEVFTAIRQDLVNPVRDQKKDALLLLILSERLMRQYFGFIGAYMAIVITAFPIFLLVLYLMPQVRLITVYLKLFCFGKTLPLCAAISSYIGLFYLQLQQQVDHSISSFWKNQSFCAVTAAVLVLSILLSFLMIQRIGERP